VADEVLEVCRERGVPLWLAGGLRPESIREIVETWNPELVDVSSGLEAYPGKKDPEKVRRFFKEIQNACTVVGR
jgi:phosphoribosylanthranilate isomerase